MAETIVALVIDRLVQLLLEEENLFKRGHRDMESVKDELESIKCFLKDIEARSDKEDIHNGAKTWVKQVRDKANHVEDIINEYIRHVVPRHHQSGFFSFPKKIDSLIKQLKADHNIASEA